MGLDALQLEEERAPETAEFAFADDIVLKAVRFDTDRPSIGTQHMHAHDHISVVLGPFAVFVGNRVGIPDDAIPILVGDIGQPFTIKIEAHKFHRFCSLRGGGVLLCIARGHGTGKPVIEKEAPKLRH